MLPLSHSETTFGREICPEKEYKTIKNTILGQTNGPSNLVTCFQQSQVEDGLGEEYMNGALLE